MRAWLWLLAAAVAVVLVGANRQRWGRIETQYTFRPPATESLSNWRMGGATLVDGDVLKFRPKSQQRSAYLWNTQPVTMTSWEVVLQFRVNGPAPLNTGEGLAFWHVSDPGTEGAVYGHSDMFNGVGIFFDSYDADGDGTAESYVLAMYNDGTKPIDAEGAGTQLGVCFADYRNLPHPARAKIAYTPDNGGHLTVGLDISNTGKFKSCISVKDVKLRPTEEFFGLTVSDYGSDFDIDQLLGINTSERFEPGQGPPNDDMHADAVMPMESESEEGDDSPAHPPGFSEHEHFERILELTRTLDEKLFAIEDNFGKQFASIFQNHNSNFEHYISNKLQLDVNDKHESIGTKVDSMHAALANVQASLSAVRAKVDMLNSGGGGGGSSSLSPSIEDVNQACVKDTSRGQNLVAQLKDSVASLKQRQESVLKTVHQELEGIKANVGDACSGSVGVGPVLLYFVVGLAVGAGLTLVGKASGGRHRRWT